ncbi:VanW family protein [Neobacillus novalis]
MMPIKQPIKRSQLRIYLGTKYYRLKRYWEWYTDGKSYAKQKETAKLKHIIFTHKTVLLRQLKDVVMWLQHNKVKNLTIAVKSLNGIILKPGETFSYWTRTYEVYEKEHLMTQEYWGGYARHNKSHRKVYNLNQELFADEYITENNAIMMYEPFLPDGNS